MFRRNAGSIAESGVSGGGGGPGGGDPPPRYDKCPVARVPPTSSAMSSKRGNGFVRYALAFGYFCVD
jgi:hypothetical protein